MRWSAPGGAPASGIPAAGWFPDPLAPDRLRYWGGRAWTAWVSAVETDPPTAAAVSWWHTLPRLDPPSIQTSLEQPALVFTSVPTAAPAIAPSTVGIPEPVIPDTGTPETGAAHSVTPAPVAPAPTAPVGAFGGYASDPLVIAFGADAVRAHSPSTPPATPKRARRRLVPLIAAAALVAVAAAAVAGAAVLRNDDQRPDVAATITDRDTEAGFALQYPEGWHVQERDAGTGIRFTIAAPGAPTTDTNTVSVSVGPTPAALPQLHALADQLTEKLQADLPGIELASASETRLADAPAFHFTFRDLDASPPTTIEQYVGRTTAGRPLTITITTREPRTAPSAVELRDFVASLTPA